MLNHRRSCHRAAALLLLLVLAHTASACLASRSTLGGACTRDAAAHADAAHTHTSPYQHPFQPVVTMASEQKQSPASRENFVAENESLRAELAMLKRRLNGFKSPAPESSSAKTDGPADSHNVDPNAHLSIVVLGASGDLSIKKTFPSLFALFRHGLMPKRFTIVGYARSVIQEDAFRKKISAKFPAKSPQALKDEFLSHCWYVQGQYDSPADFTKLDQQLQAVETKAVDDKSAALNRIFYMALPPTAFVPAAKSLAASAKAQHGWTRLVVEKPFGHDSASSEELGRELGALFAESEIYRIDHYLGKEMVQNLQVLRFANTVFEPLWNRDHINCVQITFKEDFGVQGRGGYFDSFGIIRDVMQNHLLQMLSIVAMETPISLSAEDVRDEKVKLLRSIAPITVQDTVIGQYTADPKGREAGYLDDPEVPKDSVTPTYAACVLHVNTTRWMGTPFIVKCGKALNEKKADIRIQFKHPINTLFDDVSPNELVLRVGPDEAVYLKMTTKEPGLDGGNRHTELDLTYHTKFKAEMKDAPDAYERLLLDVIRGDHNLFVRADELAAAWRIFTPLLHAIENDKALTPIKYEFGSRGPPEADKLVHQYGYVHTPKYKWSEAEEKKRLLSSPSSAASAPKAEPPVLAAFVKLVESAAPAASFAELFTADGVVDSSSHVGQSPLAFYTAFLAGLSGAQLLNKHKLIDPAQPNSAALHFTAQGEAKLQTVELLELAEDGAKIKKVTHLTVGPQAKL